MNEYYVYALCDPRKNDQPFYIGKGKKDRAKAHLKENVKGENRHKDNVIAAIQAEKLEVTIKYLYKEKNGSFEPW